MAVTAACKPLPEVAYETEYLRFAPDFDHPICGGTLARFNAQVRGLRAKVGRLADTDPVLVYWLPDRVSDYCGDDRIGCFFPGTRVIMGKGVSIGHELVHAAFDSDSAVFFVEEGLAEFYSGDGVVLVDPQRQASLGDALRISRSSYRDGAVDYAAATHFIHWLRSERGVQAADRLAGAVAEGASVSAIETTLEDVFGQSVGEIETAYRDAGRQGYEGLAHGDSPTLDLGIRTEIRLDCDDESTLGPLWDGQPGMMRAFRLDVPVTSDARISVESSGAAWVRMARSMARGIDGRYLTDWAMPNPTRDPKMITVSPGGIGWARLARGSWMVVVGSDAPDEVVDISLQVLPYE